MDPLDLAIEPSHEMDEIEHWCPVCDRLFTPSPPGAEQSAPTPASPANTTTSALENAASSNTPLITSPTPTTPTTANGTAPPTPVHKRRSATATRLGGGRPTLNRSRTSTGLQSKRKTLDHRASNPNPNTNVNPNKAQLQDLITDFVLSTVHNAGARTSAGGATPCAPAPPNGSIRSETAPRSKTSPMGDTFHLDNAVPDLQGGPVVLRSARANTNNSNVDGKNTNTIPNSEDARDGARSASAAVIKRKASAPDVGTAGLPRLKPLTKSRPSGKPRPKSLNLVIAQGEAETDGASSKTPKTLVASPTVIDGNLEPQSAPAAPAAISRPRYTVEDLRRRLYCSEECYKADLHGDASSLSPIISRSPKFQEYPTTIATFPPRANVTARPFEVKRNLSCEMPWLWTRTNSHGSRALRNSVGSVQRRMAPTRNPSWIDRGEADREDNGAEEEYRSPPSAARSTLEDSQSPHRLFFRRMPGKMDAAPVPMPPLFVVDGHWTETPPPGFDYAAFMAEREKERRRRQIEITQAMLLKKDGDDEKMPLTAGGVDVVSKRHLDSARRKKKADTERSQYERKMRTVHGPAGGFYDRPNHVSHPKQEPWWHLDEREDWKAYWAARDAGDVEEDVSWEMWQVRRHRERVARVEKEEALKRVEEERNRVLADVAAAADAAHKQTAGRKHTAEHKQAAHKQAAESGDRKKVAKRPFLIRMASQPTTSDVDLVAGLYEEGEKRMSWIKEQQLQRTTGAAAKRTATSSSEEEASSPGMNHTKALPAIFHRDSSVEGRAEGKSESGANTPSSFMRGHTLCIPGFVIEEKVVEAGSKDNVVPQTAPGFVFPLVAVPGSIESGNSKVVPGAASSPPSRRLPPGLALPASALIGSVPTSVLGDPPGLRRPDHLIPRPQLKKSNTLPVDPPSSQLAISGDTPADLSSRRRVQSLKSLTLTIPNSSENNIEKIKRSSLVIPRSPLGLHSLSATELPPMESRGRKAINVGRSGGASSVSRPSSTRSKQGDGSSGSQRRLTLEPHVDCVTATAITSPVYPCSSLRTLGLAQLGLSADPTLSGSSEMVTAVSGVGSGSGSSGEESTWSRAEIRPQRNATIKVASTMNLSRMQRNLAFTKVRPTSMGPLEPKPSASETVSALTHVESSNDAVADSPLPYSASLLRCYSEFRSGSVPNGAKLNALSSSTTGIATAMTEKEAPAGERRSLWGIFGSAKP